MTEIIRMGFEEYNLNDIYWCVSPKNRRACKFYDKNDYCRIDIDNIDFNKLLNSFKYTKSEIDKYYWYYVKNDK